jgi:hypothetical protein
MSVDISMDQGQLGAVITELRRVQSNISGEIRPRTVNFMNSVMGIAEGMTHKISGTLARSWGVKDEQKPDGIIVTLFNQVSYAEQEFDRPGVRDDVGTPHDVRPELEDLAFRNIETVVYDALTEGL